MNYLRLYILCKLCKKMRQISIQENRRLGIPVVEEIWNAVLKM